ncbi:hypothetical protein Zmor_011705 [Zophobas morio]|uniref:Uncharacterized protein n=1 Tax=Zophobas morio TaxID=2755281 RepID=A0AA38MJP4_9CUCU|nr:hypothetical protein Zmor_011705 [Zophobas morio]
MVRRNGSFNGNDSQDRFELLRAGWKALNKSYKSKIIDAKKTHWQNYVSSSTRNSNDPWGGVYKLLRGKKGPTDLMAVEVNGRIAGSWLEAAETLLNRFFGPATDLPLVEETEMLRDALEETVVTQDMVKKCLSKIKGRKAPGLDGFTGTMLKKLFLTAPDYILAIINKCFSEGTFPKQWKVAKVIILLKSPDKPKTSQIL